MFEIEKFGALIVTAIATVLIKFISYKLNLTGEKDKTTKENFELLKSLIEKENSLHIAEYKILYEEVFSLIYKKSIPFSAIKIIFNKKSPMRTSRTYTESIPYVKVNKTSDGFTYTMPNKILLFGKIKSFPIYRALLCTIYVAFFIAGWLAITFTDYFFVKSITNQPNPSVFSVVILIFSSLVGLAFFILSIKALWKALDTPGENKRKEDLGEIEDYIFNPLKKNIINENTTIKTFFEGFNWYFLQLMFSTFLLFFLTAAMGKASVDVILYMNDPKQQKTIIEWIIFWILLPISTWFWCALWLWFKNSEKKCLELLPKK